MYLSSTSLNTPFAHIHPPFTSQRCCHCNLLKRSRNHKPANMPLRANVWLTLSLVYTDFATGQQECYFGPGAVNRGPSNLVPCMSSGESACCLLGDTCLSGNTCYNFLTGDLYQYGCTDITYTSPVYPYKCGWNSSRLLAAQIALVVLTAKQLCRYGLL